MLSREERLRFQQVEASWARVSAAGFQGIDCRESSNHLSFYQDYQSFDAGEQREADLAADGDDTSGTVYRDWCVGARLKKSIADPDAGVEYLRENDPILQDSDIDQAIRAAIYRTEKQEFNSHDRILTDVPKCGRRKGGTYGLPPERRRTRSAKIVNEQLLRWNCSEQECLEVDASNAAVAERINRKRDYAMEQYHGKYREVLSLLLLGISTNEIASRVGKTPRRIRQLVNGNAGRNAPGLRQFIAELCEQSPHLHSPPLYDVSAATDAPTVDGVEVRHVC
ncbi:MAG: hypothetical protein ACYCS8_17750 [Acidithiobacillus sp.]|uniref:hypothetical protein n=1 Tax=Acidithiobacillus thiooxidans TaxID=930 RepID=UPI0009DA75DD|nr:hypothetical protein [Acidithiobacillus thiooxidans]